MPSTRTPTSIAIGPGQLSDNVGSASSLVALPATGAPLPLDPGAITTLVTESAALTRLSSRMIVVVDNTAGAIVVTLPDDSEAGDEITIVQRTALAGRLNEILIEPSSGDSLHGVSADVEVLSGGFGSKTYVNASAESPRLWITTAEKTVVEATSIGLNSLSRCQDQVILVDNTGGPITLSVPHDPMVGDRLTVVNATTSTNLITIEGNDSTLDGFNAELREPLGVRSWVFAGSVGGSLTWVSTFRNGPSIIRGSPVADVALGPERESIVLMDTTGEQLNVFLSGVAIVGDVVTIVDAVGNASANPIYVKVGSPFSIMGVPEGEWDIHDNFGSMTLVLVSATNWAVRAKSTPVLLEVNDNTTNLARRGPETRVFVDTAAGSWTPDTIMTPLLPAKGDRFTVVDVGGQADVKHITIVGDGTCVIGETPTSGTSQTRIAKRFGAMTLLFTGTRWIEESTSNINPFVLVADTTILARYGRDFTVHVNTALGSWSNIKTIALPSSSTQAMVGDTVTVVDTGGLAGGAAKVIRVVPSSGTINDGAGYSIYSNYGSATFVYVGGNRWIVAGTGLGRFNIVSTGDSVVLTRLGDSTLVLVNTLDLAWTSAKIITLPVSADLQTGDLVIVSDSGGSAQLTTSSIRVAPSSGSINGSSDYTISEKFGSATFVYKGSGAWITVATTRPEFLSATESDTQVFSDRRGPVFTIQVNTLSGSWSNADSITLPPAHAGDMVRVIDVATAPSGKEILILPGTGNINGADGYILKSGVTVGGTVALFRTTGGNWVITGGTQPTRTPPVTMKVLVPQGGVAIDDLAESMGAVRMSVESRILAIKANSTGVPMLGDGENRYQFAGALASVTGVTDAVSSGTRLVVVGPGGNKNCFSTTGGSGTWTAGGAMTGVPQTLVYNSTYARFICTRDDSSINHSTDGTSWTGVATSLSSLASGIAVLSNGNTVVCGIDGGLFPRFSISTNGGTTWSDAGGTLLSGYNDAGWVAGCGYHKVWHVGGLSSGGLQVSSASTGSDWTPIATFPSVSANVGVPPRLLCCQNTGMLVILAVNGGNTTAILASHDRGFSWSLPTYVAGIPVGAFALAGGRLFATFNELILASDKVFV